MIGNQIISRKYIVNKVMRVIFVLILIQEKAMNFLDIIKKFNINNIDNYYEMTNEEYHFRIMPSYVYQDIIIVAIYKEDINTVNIIHINDLEKLILAFIEKKYIKLQEFFDEQSYLNNRKYYLVSKSEFLYSFTHKDPIIISIDSIIPPIDIFKNEFIILENDNNFYKMPNTNVYIYCQFRYLFDSENWDILSMYQNLDKYLNYNLDLIFINSYEHHYIHILKYLKDIQFLELIINFSREQFNDITSRLKNETILDILNINCFRKDSKNEFR